MLGFLKIILGILKFKIVKFRILYKNYYFFYFKNRKDEVYPNHTNNNG